MTVTVLKEGAMTNKEQSNRVWLKDKGQLTERPFESNTPLIGPLIVGFRSFWNSVAAMWYVRPLIQQPTEFNLLTVQWIDDFASQIYGQVINQDREQTHLMHETAALAVNLSHLNRILQSMDERLARLEELNEELEGK